MSNADDSQKVVIEIEDFITKVQMKPCLWDSQDPKYFKRDHQTAAWMDIADETHAPVSELKKRWRNLRDTFCRELRKVDRSQSDAELAAGSTWRHFGQLMFLREVVSSAKKATYKRRMARLTKYTDSNDESDDNDNGNDNSLRSSSPGSEHRDRPAERLFTSRLIVKQEPEEPRVDVTLDSDAQFLMSMLPFLQDVPKKRKLLVRAKLTQVLLDEQNAKN